MADIFISHSSKDSETAAAVGERIRRDRPTWSLFYDKDNIRAGQHWQERLREELTSCRVVLALLSRNWLGSPWCFTEAVTAAFRGKDVVGIETEDLTFNDLARAPPILHERQRVRLRDGDDRPWRQILEALDRSGLDPNDWFPIPPGVGPYPGLVAFDERDAGVFFGRKQEITEYLGILDTLRGRDRSQVLVISGASGSGKSSLLRAGLIPRLRRKPEWVVISPFEVAREPVRNLLDRLSEALAGLGTPADGLDLTTPPTIRRLSPRSWMRLCGGWSRPPPRGCSCRWTKLKAWLQATGRKATRQGLCSMHWPKFSAGEHGMPLSPPRSAPSSCRAWRRLSPGLKSACGTRH
jgi:hypothetical protein